MANTKKYVSFDKLSVYDELLKAKIATDDAAVLQSAKDYADGLASNYDAAGSASSALAEAKTYADGKDAAIATAKKAGDDAQSTIDAYKTSNDAVVQGLRTDLDALDSFVGDIPEGYTETDIVSYIGKVAADTLAAATGDGGESAASVKLALDNYKAENDPKVTANATAAANAQSAAEAAQSAADTAQDTVDALAEKVGEVPADKTVVQMISDAQAAATYDDTQVKADIAANAEAIASEKERMDAFMALGDGETLNTALDSLKELQDYITTEAADADVLVGKVSALEAIVDGIGGEGEKATVVSYVTDAIEALKIGDYAKATELAALAEKVTTAEGKIATAEGKIADNETAIAALQTAVGDGGSVDEMISEAISAEVERVDAAIDEVQKDADQGIADAAAALTAAQAAAKSATDLNTAMDSRVSVVEAKAHEHANAEELNKIAIGDKAKWDGMQAAAEATAANALATAVSTLEGKITTAETSAKGYADTLNSTMNTRVTSLETWHTNFTEVSEDDINSLFNT